MFVQPAWCPPALWLCRHSCTLGTSSLALGHHASGTETLAHPHTPCGSVPHPPPPAGAPQETSFGNLWLAGDWVKGVQHGANGLSQASRQQQWCCMIHHGAAMPWFCLMLRMLVATNRPLFLALCRSGRG